MSSSVPFQQEKEIRRKILRLYIKRTKARKLLNLKPTISLEDGLTELAEWAKTHDWGAIDLFEKALKELKEKRLAA